MKKPLQTGFLSLVIMAILALLPTSALAAEKVPTGWTPVYCIADLQKQETYYHDKIILMNDIDANNEDYRFYTGNSDAPTLSSYGLSEDMTFDGNGHTIYNMKSGIWRYNSGTVRNLNISIHDTEEDSKHLSDWGTSNYVHDIDYFGIAKSNAGLIENCNVTMTIDLKDQFLPYIGGITLSNTGTIRNCIVNMNVDLTVTGYISGAEMGGIAQYSSGGASLIDHCLVLGHYTSSGNQSHRTSVVGLASLSTDTDRCINSDFAMEKVEVTCQSDYYFSPAFQTWTGSAAGAENCRVANDIPYIHIVTNSDAGNSKNPVNESGIFGEGDGYTLATRAKILADWDLTKVPAATPPTPITWKRIPFHFESNSGYTRSWQFDYDDNYFYSQDDGYGYNPDLAKASLCMEMTTFSTNANATWSKTLEEVNTIRANNIKELFIRMGFDSSSFKFVNYDNPLTDTSDKVGYSMAIKYINSPNGETDTLIAVPIRGGGYGGEWASNFHLYGDGNSNDLISLNRNHKGFQTAANEVKSGLDDYIRNHEIKGDLKIWVVGYSRAAAVANLLGQSINNATLGGEKADVSDIYVYTFATPAGADKQTTEMSYYAPNIYNIVSPVDMVPRVAPSQWGFTRYGTTLYLPSDGSDELWNTFRDISTLNGHRINASQQAILDNFCNDAFRNRRHHSTLQQTSDVFGLIPYENIQQKVMDSAGNALGKNATQKFSNETVAELLGAIGLKALPSTAKVVTKLKTIGMAHYAEHYLARLETDDLQTEDDFERKSHVRSVLLYPIDEDQMEAIQNKPLPINVEFWNVSRQSTDSNVKYANASGQSVGSYIDGVCTSGEVSVEMTDMGLIATFPAEKDYTFTMTGTDTTNIAMTIFAHCGSADDSLSRTIKYKDIPITTNTSYTVSIPEDPYEEFIAEDANGNEIYPDFDSDVDEYEEELEMPFNDVPEGAYYYDAVLWAVDRMITSGTSETTFSPELGCTRAQVVTFLWRAAEYPEPESNYNPFTDVSSDQYYYKAVLWAAEEGITTGTTTTTFSPNATVTRGQTVTFLWRWDGSPEPKSTNTFRDVPANAYYADAVSWAVEWEITNGSSATTFSPEETCTRAQIVTFLYRDLY